MGFWQKVQYDWSNKDEKEIRQMVMQDQAGIALIAALSMTVSFGGVMTKIDSTSHEQDRLHEVLAILFCLGMYTSGLFSTLGVLSSTFKYLRLNVTPDHLIFEFLHRIESEQYSWMHNAWVWTRYGLNSLCLCVSISIYFHYGLLAFSVCVVLAALYLLVAVGLVDMLEKGWQDTTKPGDGAEVAIVEA